MTATQEFTTERSISSLRVLIIDDDRDQAEGLADLLQPHGFQVAVAHRFDEARQSLKSFDAQVALVDVRLGTESGIDMVRELRQSHPDVLCVMITAYADMDNTIESLQEGVFDFLRKPLSPASLFVSLERCADRLRLEREKEEVKEEKKVLQAQLRHAQKMDAVGQLAAGVAHEFNNLLVGILGNAESLLAARGQHFPDRFRQPLNDIAKAGRRAADLTQQLLSFARRKNPKVSVFDINHVVADSESMLRRLVGGKIELRIALDPQPCHVRADGGDLERALVNLVINSRDAMPDGGSLTIQTEIRTLGPNEVGTDSESGPFVRLAVTDEGCGMSPEVAQRIFEPFFTTKSVGKGTGLGLSVVYADVASCGGFLAVDSQIGRGTTIYLHLPRIEGSIRLVGGGTKRASSLVGGNETVMICDDEEIVLDSLALVLTNLGYTVIGAGSPQEAITLVMTHDGPISLLLSDFTMPGMNGVQLGQEITRLRPDIKVLLTSGYAEDVLPVHPQDDVQFDFIQKPTPSNELARRIREVLDQERVSDD